MAHPTLHSLAREVATRAGVTEAQAEKVLALFRFERFLERAEAIEKVYSDPTAKVAVGVIPEDVQPLQSGELLKLITLDNLRLVPSRHAAMKHPVLQLMGHPA